MPDENQGGFYRPNDSFCIPGEEVRFKRSSGCDTVYLNENEIKKKNQEQLSQDERLILNELQKNSKDSINQITKTCGFSRQKVKWIMTHLETDQTIWGYTAIIDEKRQGLLKYLLLLKRSMNKVDRTTVEKIAFQQFEKEYER